MREERSESTSKSDRFSQPSMFFRGRSLPELASPAGYAALIAHYNLKIPLPPKIAAVAERFHPQSSPDCLLVTPRHRPLATLAGHLEFALKWEGVDLSVLKALTNIVPAKQFEVIVRETPTGTYARRIWFLYEWLTGQTLDLPNAGKVRAIPVIDNAQQFGLHNGQLSTRHRVIDNLPGTRAFSPLVRKTPRLAAFAAKHLDRRAREVLGRTHRDIVARAAAFLLLSDSRASFDIEGEHPSRQRTVRWAQAIKQAGAVPLNLHELERLQSIVIGDNRFVHLGLRTEGGFVGNHDRITQEPIPDHISARAEDLRELITGVVEYVARAIVGELDPVVIAATAAFGFVYIHPFEDGNGRLHRWLIHHALAVAGYNPPGIVFPVSAAILREIQTYKQVLESYSQSLLPNIEWEPTERGNIRVLNETVDYYRYFDATIHTEFLYNCVEATVERDLPDEVAYLEGYDRFATQVQHVVELPARTIELLHHFLRQNHGRLSKRARGKEFSALTEDEVAAIERLYEKCFPNQLDQPVAETPPEASKLVSAEDFIALPRELQKEQLVEAARKLATPVDIPGLIAAGIIKKSRGHWYEVFDMGRLPDHARAQIKAMRFETAKDGSKHYFVQIPPVTKRAIRLSKALSRD